MPQIENEILNAAQESFFRDREKQAIEHVELGMQQPKFFQKNIRGRRKSESSLRNMTVSEMEESYQVQIVHDITITRENIRDVELLFEDEPLVRGTNLAKDFNGHFNVVIKAYDLMGILDSPLL